MKRKTFFVLWVLLVFGFVVSPCFAQSSNNEQRLVGTWINQMDNSTLVINSDGTGVVDEDGALYGPGGAFTYGVAAGKMIIIIKDRNPQTFDFFISNDGRTLILTVRDGRGILFRKKN